MNQDERRLFLIHYLKNENQIFADLEVPEDKNGQEQLLRAMMNVRCPDPIGEDFLSVQDEYLQERALEKGIVDASFLPRNEENLSLWRGDITRLKCDGIVNAANSSLEGCYHANHNCIDNAIHTYAGVQLRRYCSDLIRKQGHEEKEGKCKVTPAFNLPSTYVFHTVGPRVEGPLEERHVKALQSSYEAILNAAKELKIASLALCSISTGVFGFPVKKAASIALETVRRFQMENGSDTHIIFCVYSKEDEEVYRKLLVNWSMIH